jgi:hypothetical protein
MEEIAMLRCTGRRSQVLLCAAAAVAALAAPPSCSDDASAVFHPMLADGGGLGVRIQAECAFGPTIGDCDGRVGGTQSGAQLESSDRTIGFFDGGDYLAYPGVDFTGLDSLLVSFASANGGVLQVRLDAADGRLLAEHEMAPTSGWQSYQDRRIPLQPADGIHDLYIVGAGTAQGIGNFDWFQLDVCRPACGGKSCGDDACGGTCGVCPDGSDCTDAQQCLVCQPTCDGKSCGDDTCGGSCGSCLDGDVCAADGSCHRYDSLGGPPRLHVEGNVLENPAGEHTIVRGVSLIDMATQRQSRPGGVTAALDRLTAAGWATAIVRFPVYTDPAASITPFSLTDRAARETYMARILRPAVDYATGKGLYVIIDFHQISNVTPQKDRDATAFWQYMAGQFAGYPNVIYELFNEPVDNVGACVQGTTDSCWPPFKQKANGWISVVRQQAPDTLLLVGGPSWSQVIGPAADDPVADPNVAYVGHIYPQHLPGGAVAAQIVRCAAAHPVILTEWGYASTDDPAYVDVMRSLLDANGLSWTAWVADYDWKPPMYTAGTGALNAFGMTVQDWLSAPVPPPP